ncbi:28S ribosomal protein S11, mitochondrial [Pseudolycoriella hygida]|uniref:28S ribosomal protein S11, mitochondrial n=1 Tax=Pseudolycoriella hygida TaxID=35572 RepID=A0A9Q0MS25_9DIPT|nr:28S ribosomal protein S11, mitochondrial [Pseudolycoriella hygida]
MSLSLKLTALSSLLNVLKTNVSNRTLTMSSALMDKKVSRGEDRKQMLASMPAKDEGTLGERTTLIDSLISAKQSIFPDGTTNTSAFNGQIFNDIPIIHVRVSKNNTIVCFTDAQGVPKIIRSCGIEGFKNTRKGTNIAAQATASTLSAKVVERGVKNVRITVRGLGPGRMSALKGIQMSGLNVVSVTDTTPVSWNPPRPRKARRL